MVPTIREPDSTRNQACRGAGCALPGCFRGPGIRSPFVPGLGCPGTDYTGDPGSPKCGRTGVHPSMFQKYPGVHRV